MFFILEFYDGITNEAGSKYCRFKSVSYFGVVSCGQCCYSEDTYEYFAEYFCNYCNAGDF